MIPRRGTEPSADDGGRARRRPIAFHYRMMLFPTRSRRTTRAARSITIRVIRLCPQAIRRTGGFHGAALPGRQVSSVNASVVPGQSRTIRSGDSRVSRGS